MLWKGLRRSVGTPTGSLEPAAPASLAVAAYGPSAISLLLLVLTLGGASISNARAEINDHSQLGWVGNTLDGTPCTGSPGGYGPYDYWNPRGIAADPDVLYRVEQAHYPTHVRRLERGNAGTLMGDIDYTLRAIPNHPHALFSLIEYYFQWKGGRQVGPSEERFIVPECYLQRAVTFRPNDVVARMLLGVYLHRRGQYEQALKVYEDAAKTRNRPYAELYYNMGLTLVALERWEEAREAAKIAYQHGYPLLGLKRKLQDAEKW